MKLAHYHPVIIEGMGGYDKRDPHQVASQVVKRLMQHWTSKPPVKSLLILTQGDPIEASGIAAITPRVAQYLGIQRGLVYLDEHIADYHWSNADRREMVFEQGYSELAVQLNNSLPGSIQRIEAAIDGQINKKNRDRSAQGNPALKDYFRDFALLQEVTKAACSRLCEGITIVHTSQNISVYSVSSFYTVGLELGLVDFDDMVSYSGNTESQLSIDKLQ